MLRLRRRRLDLVRTRRLLLWGYGAGAVLDGRVTANWVWSEPLDRNNRVAAARLAVRNTGDAAEESDVWIVATAADAPVTATTDLTTETLTAFVALDSVSPPLSITVGVTVVDAETVWIKFTADAANGILRGQSLLVSLYAGTAGSRRLLMQGSPSVGGTAKNPPP